MLSLQNFFFVQGLPCRPAFGTIYTKKHAVHFNPYFGLGLQMVISGIVVTGISYATGKAIPLTAIPWQSWASVGYLVAVGSVFFYPPTLTITNCSDDP